MTITALSELRPRPDQTDVVVQRALAQLSLPSQSVAGRRFARLYQHVDDPAWLLYLAEWTSRAALDAYRQTAPMPGSLDQFQQPPSLQCYQRLALFERVLTPVTLVHIDTVDGPATTHAARGDILLAHHRSEARNWPGLALLQVCEGTDSPPSLLLVTGWEMPPAAGPHAHDSGEALISRLMEHGGTVRRFVGRTVVEASAI